MTPSTRPLALRQLHTALRRALADPEINTSEKRAERLRFTVSTLERAAADLAPDALRSLPALFRNDVLGHPNEPDTVLARIAAGEYRTRPPYGKALTSASQRALMDGIVDLNRAYGRRPFWWEIPGGRPWSKHTRVPLDPGQHIVLRRALTTPVDARREPYRLRLLSALEVLWSTGVTREGLVASDTTDLAPDLSTIELTVNPPGRTEATVQTFPLPASAQAALRLWLPVRREVIAKHLREGPDHPANQAVFVTLRHTVGAYPGGEPRMVPPGVRIAGNGLETNYSEWARRLNGEHVGQQGWPVPTDLYRIARGGAEQLDAGQ
ncbi:MULTISPECIES: hypothetical protein [Streptomyces]|uniref:hypothetical protein n=1 Tax=Streptomyces TaxID=1883 RepID=UPI0029B553D6|nr:MULTISPECIES: hypothetical protein [Streptomyces]MDX3122740.1 hypothetical protein [Streptomyces scabiei]MDX3199339.1 hypothetical protein [Streptomyces scabiei]MDX3223221.1 hypothetical protein [Streptomyces scabiei]MDX3672700.1 hypothetical protein [Streptomyces europaeiscabiei]